MNIQQATVLSTLNANERVLDRADRGVTQRAEYLAERVYDLAAEQGTRLEGTPKSWRDEWLVSRRFRLLDIPLRFAACPMKADNASKVQGFIRAAAGSVEPIIIDVNKKKLGRAAGDYFPPAIVVDGKHRAAAHRLQGRETIRAWVGENAIMALGLDKVPTVAQQEQMAWRARRKARVVPVEIAAAEEKIVRDFTQAQVSSIEAAMQIFGTGGGMGGPGSSLGNGSGPSLAMKPRPTPGNITMRSKAMKKKKLKSTGYFGYKKASDTQSQKTKGASNSDMAKQLKGSGYYGYNDVTSEEQQKMKSPKGSEFNNPKVRQSHVYDSHEQVQSLKGAAKVRKIITDYKNALHAGYRHAKEEMQAVAPPGMEHIVKGLKKHFGEGSSSPFKIAWWMHKGGKKKMSADVDINHKNVDLHERMPRRRNPAEAV